jgi:ABC-2 type transport system ATP-binding protein
LNILSINNISKSYSNHKALSDVSMTVPKQSIFGLLGPNGAGKTTLIRIINQIITSDAGSIEINGAPLNQDHVRVIGYLPEERGLYKKMKVGEHLLYFAQLKGLNKRDSIIKIKDWFKKLDIPDWLDKKVEDLSKGMQQKVQFIGTVLHDPELIILDEPFSGFDPINANIIKDEILELREKGSTIIFSTHRMESVEELCDHIALIDESHKILDGPKKEIKDRYRSQTYVVNHLGKMGVLDNHYEILESIPTENNIIETKVRITNESDSNQLLKHLINQTKVIGYNELIPSINDIFIQTVKEANNG